MHPLSPHEAAHRTLSRFVEALIRFDRTTPTRLVVRNAIARPTLTISKAAYVHAHLAVSAALLPRNDTKVCTQLAVEDWAAAAGNSEAPSVSVQTYISSLVELGEMWTDELSGGENAAAHVSAFLTRLLHHTTFQEVPAGDGDSRTTIPPVSSTYSAEGATSTDLATNAELASRLGPRAAARGHVRYTLAQPHEVKPMFPPSLSFPLTRLHITEVVPASEASTLISFQLWITISLASEKCLAPAARRAPGKATHRWVAPAALTASGPGLGRGGPSRRVACRGARRRWSRGLYRVGVRSRPTTRRAGAGSPRPVRPPRGRGPGRGSKKANL